MRYALFDWDNTIRKGYTLFSWMDYLLSVNVISRSTQSHMKIIQNEYAQGIISHDQYAEKACEAYAAAMQGVSVDLRDDYIRKYMELDKKAIFPFAESLFTYLYNCNIKTIVISGAPSCIIEEYADRFHLYGILAFCEQSCGGFLTGRVSYNFGTNKDKTLYMVQNRMGGWPLFSFGDSSSDVPLLIRAKYGFCVIEHDDEKGKFGDKIEYIKNTISGGELLHVISHL